MAKYSAMQFAVRPTVVGRLLSDMYGILALLTLVPAGLAWVTDSAAAKAYSGVIASLALCWLGGRLLAPPDRVQKNEALAMVALLFITSSLLLCLPLMSYGIPFMDAWFESVSGVTTTGLSTLDIAEASPAFLFGRAWMQWLGGIGVVVLALAIFVRPGVTANRLGFSDREMDDVVGGTRAHARRVIIIYLLLTALGITALYFSGASLLDAVVHCMAALSTGGFANYPNSLADVNAAHLWVVNLLCVAGAISFHLYYRSLLRSGRGKFIDNQLYTLLATLAAGIGLMWVLATLAGLELPARDLLTTVVSAQTTAGFSSTEIGALPSSMILLLCVLMAIGGGAGSTAGGFKLDRALLLFQIAHRSLLRSTLSEHVHVRGAKHQEGSRMEEALSLLVWFLAIVLLSWLVFVAYGFPPLQSLFEVVSALATVGLSSGITNAELPAELKLVLCTNMLLGRVEIIAVLVLLAPRNWIGRRRGSGEKP